MLLVERLQQAQDLVGGLAVEVAGGLVADQQLRVGHDRARDRHALLLAAGELARLVLGAVGQADHVERDADVLAPLRLAQFRQQQRQFDVAFGGEHRHQVVELEHEADIARAPFRQLPGRELVDAAAADQDLARGGLVEAADQVQQRGLAGARGPHQRHEVALGDVEREPLQHRHLLLAALVDLAHVAHLHHCLAHRSPRWPSGLDGMVLHTLLRLLSLLFRRRASTPPLRRP